MTLTIKIKEIAIYHPENAVDNEFYIEHFKKTQDVDLTSFLENVLGRKSRYIIDNDDENSLTMGVEASKKALAQADMQAEDLDMIMFSSQVPEYTFPTNAVMLHREIGAGEKTGVIDSNANCSGMTIALDQASRFLLSHTHLNNLLLVGSDYLSLLANPEDSITYPNFGDVAVAVILEKVEDENAGLLDSMYFTDSSNFDRVTYPQNGLSKAVNGKGSFDYMQWLPFDGDVSIANAQIMIKELLERNNMTPNDVNAYCLSQFAISNINLLQEHFNVEKEKMIFVGDEFGYTGTTSPLLALYRGITDGRIKRGDTVLFWTVGVGYHLIAVLYKY